MFVLLSPIHYCYDLFLYLGTREERGLTAWQEEMKGGEDDVGTEKIPIAEDIRAKKLAKTIYIIPYFNKVLRRLRALGYMPIFPRYNPKLED